MENRSPPAEAARRWRTGTEFAQTTPGAGNFGNGRGSLTTTAMPTLPVGKHSISVSGYSSAGCSFTNLPGNLHAVVLDG